MVGLLLCGGRSIRMGKDKGLLIHDNKKWAEIGWDKFSHLHIYPLISINQSQVDDYSSYFDKKDLLIDDTSLALGGPLLGLMSAHLRYPNQDILVLACDMVNMSSDLIQELIKTFHDTPAEAIAFKGDQIEPLCALYSAAGLHKIFSSYTSKSLSKHSMKYVLESLQTIYIPLQEEHQLFFKNFNLPPDLK